MKRTISLKIKTTSDQAAAFSALANMFSAACNAIVPKAQENRCWNRVALHHISYYPVRELFPALGSQMVCQAVHRVADAYKTLKANGDIKKGEPIQSIEFRPSSVNFDARTYSLRTGKLSLFTLGGRTVVSVTCGQKQQAFLASGKPKEARLILRKGIWYFNLVLDLPDAPPVAGGGGY